MKLIDSITDPSNKVETRLVEDFDILSGVVVYRILAISPNGEQAVVGTHINLTEVEVKFNQYKDWLTPQVLLAKAVEENNVAVYEELIRKDRIEE